MALPEKSLLFLGIVALFAYAEFLVRKHRGLGYDGGAFRANLGVALGQIPFKALSYLIITPIFLAAYHYAPFQWPMDDWRSWLAGFVVVEFFYYWQHRLSHTVRWFWTSHAVHHSPNEFTFPAAFRLGWTSTASLLWIFSIPPIVMGFHPIMVALILTLNLRYQFFLHTELVGKLGPLEWVLNTPSHHRVHHGSNAAYLDKNFGGVTIVFDRLFGTFAQEKASDPVVYGLTKPLISNNPIVIAFHEWRNLFSDIRRARSLTQVGRAILGRPGAAEREAARNLPKPTTPPLRGDEVQALCEQGSTSP